MTKGEFWRLIEESRGLATGLESDDETEALVECLQDLLAALLPEQIVEWDADLATGTICGQSATQSTVVARTRALTTSGVG